MTQPPDQWQPLHDGRLAAMVDVALAAGDHTLRYFRQESLSVESKADASPVTVADREAEQLVRSRLSEQFPDDTLQGEEFGEQTGASRYRWIVDPIDGTKSFVCGVPLYSTLLAVEFDGHPIGGAICLPALGEIVAAATDQGCWCRGQSDAAWKQARVSEKDDLGQAVFVTSQADAFEARGAGEAYRRLEQSAWLTRTWGDGYGYAMVATGRADLMVDAECNAWDVAAIVPVVREAGGRFTDWKGQVTAHGGDGVGTNGRLHDAVLGMLKAAG